MAVQFSIAMPLDAYRQKRKFDLTPEPAGGAPAPGGARFVVQKHAARRLHYDLRLEIDGTLKSWAVPKGPSLNPDDKRLAVRTEDHPLEYGSFEGEIPKGNYGAGTVMLWDNGDYIVEGGADPAEKLDKGELKFTLKGKKLRGGFALVRLKSDKDWLLIKHRDSYVDPEWDIDEHDGSVVAIPGPEPGALEGAVAAGMPERVEVMLAETSRKPFTAPDWLFEIKWDGMRAIATVRGDQLELHTRAGRNVTSGFPELTLLPERLMAREALLDGEIVVLDEHGRSSFERMQSRMHTAKPTAALRKSTPVDYYIFDILYCDGFDLRWAPLLERKQLLQKVLDPLPPLRYSDHILERGEDLFRLVKEKGAEGIVAKRADSRYEGGRSDAWLKLKAAKEMDVVIGGYTAPRGGREHFGALLAGLYDKNGLQFVGGVGTGFNSKLQGELMEHLKPRRMSNCPFATIPETKEEPTWAKPELIARVRFAEMTTEKRLRAPVFVGLRDDLSPEECTLAAEQKPAVVQARAPAISVVTDVATELRDGKAEIIHVELDGQRVRFSNLNKTYFPEPGYRKRDLLAYYFHVAPYILPFLKDRPLVLQRHPNGVTGKPFYQKDAGAEKPDWMKTIAIASEGSSKEINYYLANDTAALLFLANLGCIEQNPWGSRVGHLEHPDYVFFDLDPTDDTPYSSVVQIAKSVLKVMDSIGCEVFLKTSGATGMHIFLPLEPVYTYEQVRAFAEIVARLVQRELPELVTIERAPIKRVPGTVYFDYSQNAYSRPLASVYSVRPVAQATVSAPIRKHELRRTLTPAKFTLKNMPARIKKVGNFWEDFWDKRQRIEEALPVLQKKMK